MKIIYSGKTKSGEEFVIRYPEEKDLETMTDYINTLSKEQTYIRYQGEQLTLKEEKKFLDSIFKKTEKKKMVYLGIFIGGKMIGSSSIEMKDRVERHVGIFGISIMKDYRGEGTGGLLMEKVIKEAIKNIPELRIITLEVYAENEIAKSLYQKLGFTQYGILPEGVSYKGRYLDCLLMYKKII